MPLVVRLRRSSWSADTFGITCPDAERAEGLASGLPGSCQVSAVLVTDNGQARPERGYGLQGAGPQLSGAKPGSEQVGDPGYPYGGVGDDPGDQIAVAAACQDGAARIRQQLWPKQRPTGTLTLPPCRFPPAQLPGVGDPNPGQAALARFRRCGDAGDPFGVEQQLEAVRNKVQAGKLSLTAQRRDGSRTAAISAALTSGHSAIAFGYKSSPWSALIHKRALNTPGQPCDRQTASHQSALLITAAPSNASLCTPRSNRQLPRVAPPPPLIQVLPDSGRIHCR
jgi:hypothetical protein